MAALNKTNCRSARQLLACASACRPSRSASPRCALPPVCRSSPDWYAQTGTLECIACREKARVKFDGFHSD